MVEDGIVSKYVLGSRYVFCLWFFCYSVFFWDVYVIMLEEIVFSFFYIFIILGKEKRYLGMSNWKVGS